MQTKAVRDRARRVWAAVSREAAGLAGRATRSVPGLAGALCVSYGLGQAWGPLGWVALGGFLLLIDRRLPS